MDHLVIENQTIRTYIEQLECKIIVMYLHATYLNE